MRLKGYDYSTPGPYFVTVVVHRRTCCLGTVLDGRMTLNDAGRMVLAAWEGIPARFGCVRTDAVIVMPNHIHGILWIDPAPPGGTCDLGTVVGAFKSMTTVQYAASVRTHGWTPFKDNLWQRNYFEHIIRDEKSCTPIREYIMSNPSQWDQDEENPAR